MRTTIPCWPYNQNWGLGLGVPIPYFYPFFSLCKATFYAWHIFLLLLKILRWFEEKQSFEIGWHFWLKSSWGGTSMHERNFPLLHSLVSCEESSQFDFLELSPMRFLGFSWRFPQILLKLSLNNFCNDGGPSWMSHMCDLHMCICGTLFLISCKQKQKKEFYVKR